MKKYMMAICIVVALAVTASADVMVGYHMTQNGGDTGTISVRLFLDSLSDPITATGFEINLNSNFTGITFDPAASAVLPADYWLGTSPSGNLTAYKAPAAPRFNFNDFDNQLRDFNPAGLTLANLVFTYDATYGGDFVPQLYTEGGAKNTFFDSSFVETSYTLVPEPASMALVAAGLAVLATRRRRMKA